MTSPVTPVYVRTEPEPVPEEFQHGLVVDYLLNPRARTLDATFESIFRVCGAPPQAALDFALFAASVYIADKKVLRREQSDAWTRFYHLSVPVYEPHKWRAYSESAARLLDFLTGDRWQLAFRQSGRQTVQPGLQLETLEQPDAVCLFSGGLDSTTGAINLLESGRRVLLVGHYDNNHIKNDQSVVFQKLSDHYGSEQLGLVQVRVRPAGSTTSQLQSLPSKVESTVRSRSMVFLSLALLAASAMSPETEVFVPENGFISLNVPLTPARRGSSSTRTTHPYFLEGITSLLAFIGLANPIRNPFLALTKGDMLRHCTNQELLAHVSSLTISCAHPEVLRFVRQPRQNCGYCYPCLIRRAALHSIGMDNSREYYWDICRDAELIRHSKRGKDARAVFLLLNHTKNSKDSLLSLVAGGRMNRPVPELVDLQHMHERGLLEIQRLLVEKATPEVLDLAGLADQDLHLP